MRKVPSSALRAGPLTRPGLSMLSLASLHINSHLSGSNSHYESSPMILFLQNRFVATTLSILRLLRRQPSAPSHVCSTANDYPQQVYARALVRVVKMADPLASHARKFGHVFGRLLLSKSPLRSLCSQCKLILEAYDPYTEKMWQGDYPLNGRRALIWESNTLLEETAEKGCALCLLFLGMLSDNELISMWKHELDSRGEQQGSTPFLTQYWCVLYPAIRYPATGTYEERKFGMMLSHRLDEMSEIKLEAKVLEVPRNEIAGANWRTIGSSTFTSASAEQAKKWLDTCVRSHHACRVPETRFLPSRLIDVGCSHCIKPKLCLRSEIRHHSRYFTLSHCWGGQVPLRLLQSNLEQMRKRIHVPSLPKTFQDSLLVTRRLGGRYIWIDSLCIIQDSPDDWEKESSEMSEIYSHGICNIAATAAFDGSGGLIFDRNPVSVPPIRTQLSRGSTSDYNYLLINENLWGKEMSKSPLLQRAWVFQELWLSPRTLHFGSNQLYWQCRYQACCESYPAGMLKGMGHQWVKRWEPIGVDRFPLWYSGIVSYSGSSLTYGTDKLVALSGFASLFSTPLDREYCAGHWKTDNLWCELLWRPDKKKGPHSRYEKYIAPSWSWASMKGAIVWAFRLREIVPLPEILVHIVEVESELAGHNPFGQVKSGYLCVHGRIAQVTAFPLRDSEHILDWGAGAHKKQNPVFDNGVLDDTSDLNDPDWSHGYPAFGSQPYELKSTNESSKLVDESANLNILEYAVRNSANNATISILPDHDSPIPAHQQQEPAEELFLLPIVNYMKRTKEGICLEGLALKMAGGKAGEFVRWGTFVVCRFDVVVELEKLCSLFDETAEESGLEYHRDGTKGLNYTITII